MLLLSGFSFSKSAWKWKVWSLHFIKSRVTLLIVPKPVATILVKNECQNGKTLKFWLENQFMYPPLPQFNVESVQRLLLTTQHWIGGEGVRYGAIIWVINKNLTFDIIFDQNCRLNIFNNNNKNIVISDK